LKIKRYVVRDMQEAVRLIKQDLGPEAVIVSSYRVPAKGLVGFFMPRLLEVTAALDEPHETNLRLKKTTAKIVAAGHTAGRQIGSGECYQWQQLVPVAAGNRASRQSSPAAPTPVKQQGYGDRTLYLTGGGYGAGQPEDPPDGGRAESPDDGEREVQLGAERRSLFEMIVNKHIEAGQGEEPVFNWRRALIKMDVDEKIVDSLLSNLGSELSQPGDEYEKACLNLKKQVVRLLEPAYNSTAKARVMTFVGPTGVGKTTTLAKLATKYILNEHKKVALVAVQAYRLGAMEQLQAYGDFLGIPVEVVMTPAELARVLENHSDKDYIFVDTAGRSPRNNWQLLELKSFLDAVNEPQDIFLVLSLTTKNQDLSKIAYEFQKIKCSKIIFTKLDETETFGSILNLVFAYGMPVAYLANGQGIPDCISEAKPRVIAELLFRGVDPDEVMAT